VKVCAVSGNVKGGGCADKVLTGRSLGGDSRVKNAQSNACRDKTLLLLWRWVPTLLGCWRHAVQTARLIIGVPDYDTYVEHLRIRHPQREPMSYEAFFIERQNARYKGGGGRCC
jgi:uncharacterized short protein YbdD (DUF466 family)